MSNKVLKWAVVSLIAGSSLVMQPALAQYYGGVSIGSTSTSIDTSAMLSTATASSLTKDERDNGYKIFGGYKLNQNFALEAGYVNLGKFSATKSATAPFVGSLTVESKLSGWQFDVVGALPIGNDFSLIGKLGTIYSTTKMTATGTGAVNPTNPSAKRSEWNYSYGAGLQYDINKSIMLRAEWERYDKLGSSTNGCASCTGEGNYNLYSVGIGYKF